MVANIDQLVIPDLIVTKNPHIAEWIGYKLSQKLESFGSYKLIKDWLKWIPDNTDRGVILPDIKVTKFASEKIVKNKHVYGNLPIFLAAHCKTFTEVVFRDADMSVNKMNASLAQLKSSNAYLKTYLIDEAVNCINSATNSPFSIVRHTPAVGDVFTIQDRSDAGNPWMVLVASNVTQLETRHWLKSSDPTDKSVIVVPIVPNVHINPQYEHVLELFDKPHNVKSLCWEYLEVADLKHFSYVTTISNDDLYAIREKLEAAIIAESKDELDVDSDLLDRFANFIDCVACK